MYEPIVIAPEGELDVASIAAFRDALSRAGTEDGKLVVVDLSSVSFIDSGGLGALVEFHHRLRRHRRRLAVVAPDGTAAALLLNLAGLHGRVSVFPTREAAIAT